MEATTQQPTLVLGGTGKTGRRVAQRLRAAACPSGSGPSSQPPFDWSDQATWAPALQNIDAVYLTYYLTWPSQGPPPQSARSPSWPWNAESGGWCCCRAGARRARRGEQAVRESGANWTIVRSAFMAQNFNESFFLEPLRAGEVAFPAGEDLAEPFIDAEDIADVAVAALTGDGHVGQLYEVTGPRLLGWADAVAEIARATGRPIRYLPVSLEDYATLLIEQQVPAEVVKMLTGVFTEVLDGRNAHLSDGVQRALGRPPRDFADYARDAAATGVWTGSAAA